MNTGAEVVTLADSELSDVEAVLSMALAQRDEMGERIARLIRERDEARLEVSEARAEIAEWRRAVNNTELDLGMARRESAAILARWTEIAEGYLHRAEAAEVEVERLRGCLEASHESGR